MPELLLTLTQTIQLKEGKKSGLSLCKFKENHAFHVTEELKRKRKEKNQCSGTISSSHLPEKGQPRVVSLRNCTTGRRLQASTLFLVQATEKRLPSEFPASVLDAAALLNSQ